MALPTNTQSTYATNGIREDLTDIIHDISPTDTPFYSMTSKGSATAIKHEWQTDALAAASATNAVLEGDEATTDAHVATVRLNNYCQISDKVARVTGTVDAVNKAGRGKEMAYQIGKKVKELKRDIESSMLANNATVAGDATTARESAGVPAWLATNTSAGSGGSDPTGDGTDARTDGTQRAFTEALLKTVLQSCWDEGGDPDCIMVGSKNKQTFSGFTGRATNGAEEAAASKRITASVDVYVSDFGELKVMANRFQRARDALILQKDMWKMCLLRPVKQTPLAKTGDSERRQIVAEWTLEACNEKASGIVADLTT